MKRLDQLDTLLQHFEPAQLLEELVRGMSDAEFQEAYDFIIRMWGIDIEEEEEN